MLQRVFATKLGMGQAWTNQGKRLPVTKCRLEQLLVVNQIKAKTSDSSETSSTFEIGYQPKKIANMSKALRSKLEKAGHKTGVRHLVGVTANEGSEIKVGDALQTAGMLEVGEIVKVQGTTKGRGFSGAVKRHGFSGGPRTHGQSDRERAVGSIGAGTTPGHVWKGKRMPGHYGTDIQTVDGLVVVHIDTENQEVWLSGPVPGHRNAALTIIKTGKSKTIELDKKASGITEKVVAPEAAAEVEATAEVTEAPVAEEATETQEVTE